MKFSLAETLHSFAQPQLKYLDTMLLGLVDILPQNHPYKTTASTAAGIATQVTFTPELQTRENLALFTLVGMQK